MRSLGLPAAALGKSNPSWNGRQLSEPAPARTGHSLGPNGRVTADRHRLKANYGNSGAVVTIADAALMLFNPRPAGGGAESAPLPDFRDNSKTL